MPKFSSFLHFRLSYSWEGQISLNLKFNIDLQNCRSVNNKILDNASILKIKIIYLCLIDSINCQPHEKRPDP